MYVTTGKVRDCVANKGYLERLSSVNLSHEVATVKFAHHFERGTCEPCSYLYARIGELDEVRIRILNASDELDVGVCRMEQVLVRAFARALFLRVDTLMEEQRHE